LQLTIPQEIYRKPASSAVAEFVGLSTIFAGTLVDKQIINVGFAQVNTRTERRVTGKSVFVMIRPEDVY
jgi:putative spermidine/putrescine transport system ATP-binding protein